MPGTSRPRIIIADDHSLIAEALKKLLSTDFDVVALVHDGRTLIEAGQKLQPDVILVDIGMPLLNGLEAARRIRHVLPDVKVIYVTINHDSDLVAEALRRGAAGYLPKTAAASELKAAIHCALNGEVYVSPSLAKSDLDAPNYEEQFVPSHLTDRQVEVLQLLAEGKSMKEAAALLNLTPRTVAFHKYRLMDSLQLRNDAEVVQYALRHHMVFH